MRDGDERKGRRKSGVGKEGVLEEEGGRRGMESMMGKEVEERRKRMGERKRWRGSTRVRRKGGE